MKNKKFIVKKQKFKFKQTKIGYVNQSVFKRVNKFQNCP